MGALENYIARHREHREIDLNVVQPYREFTTVSLNLIESDGSNRFESYVTPSGDTAAVPRINEVVISGSDNQTYVVSQILHFYTRDTMPVDGSFVPILKHTITVMCEAHGNRH